MSCTCQSCCSSGSDSSTCLQEMNCGSGVVVENDSCEQGSLPPIECSVLNERDGKWIAADGSYENPISLCKVAEELSGAAIFVRDANGKMRVIPYKKEFEGMFLGFIDGEVKAFNVDRELLQYKESSIGSNAKAQLAGWGCGPDGKLTLGKIDLKGCGVSVDADGYVECEDKKVCLNKASFNITSSKHLVALNDDECLGRIVVPQDADKCYEVAITRDQEDENNVVRIRELQSHFHFVATYPNVLDQTITETTVQEGEFDLTSRIPEGTCPKAVQLLLEGKVQAASRATAEGFVLVGGVPVLAMSSYWYNFDTGRSSIILPLRNDNVFGWRFTKAGTHAVNPTLKIRLISFID